MEWYLWLIIGFIFIILEIIFPVFVFLIFGISAILVAIPAYLHFDDLVQYSIFVSLSGLGLLFVRPFAKKFMFRGPEIKTNVDALIGKIGVVNLTLRGPNHRGEVKIGGEIWTARNESEEIIEIGQKVVVKKVVGSTLWVEKIN